MLHFKFIKFEGKMRHFIFALLISLPSVALGLEADGSYTSTDGDVQIAAQGKHWINRILRIDGRYNKIEGHEDRFSYGVLSRNLYHSFVFESSARVFDTHRSFGSQVGIGYKALTISGGGRREFPDNFAHVTFATISGRLAKVSYKKMSLEGRYTYVYSENTDRHDYKAEGRLSGERVYMGARYEHVRQIVVQGIFAGVKF